VVLALPRSARFRKIFSFLSGLLCLGDPNIGIRLRSLHVRKALRHLSWSSVVDAGCSISGQVSWGGGIALNPFLLAKFNPSRLVTGGDIDHGAIARNRNLLSRHRIANLRFSVLDLVNPGGLPVHDAVVLSDVVANREGDVELVLGASKLTRPGGHVIVHTISRQQPAVLTNPSNPRLTGYTIAELEQTLAAAGGSNIHIKHTFGLFGELAWRIHHRFIPMGYPFAVVTFPTCFLIGLWDLLIPNRTGRGLLAVCHIGSHAGACGCSRLR